MSKKGKNDGWDPFWEIRSPIGLDCTLDNEEEEDEFDKVVVSRVEYGIDVNDHNELRSFFKHTARDPQANHVAARLRRREDTEAAVPTAGNLHTLNHSDNIVPPKPILKKRESFADEKPSKRVRFYEEQSSSPAKDSSSDTAVTVPIEEETIMILPCDHNQYLAFCGAAETDEAASSLYMRYNLDSSDDMNEASNRKANLDFLKMLNKPISSTKSQVDSEIFRQPLTFHPRKKAQSSSSSIIKEEEESKGRVFALSVAGCCGDVSLDDDEDSVIDEVGSETRVLADKSSLKPPGRRYQARTVMDSDDVA
ncbi:OLC1v1011928C1 [Oldenlandia corymbosa var. corymbosa]|uniref:U5 small nuclear ribonucleoprotein TSSC4 n=1 Tax=Oldenlandia corymbosa var. corymbosa TaxID=529605 RepID=A0AAV1DUR9_OLDCO|nr:OLC1v1011928C1 [Oldenlandia corymbosa var. corymbosa]